MPLRLREQPSPGPELGERPPFLRVPGREEPQRVGVVGGRGVPPRRRPPRGARRAHAGRPPAQAGDGEVGDVGKRGVVDPLRLADVPHAEPQRAEPQVGRLEGRVERERLGVAAERLASSCTASWARAWRTSSSAPTSARARPGTSISASAASVATGPARREARCRALRISSRAIGAAAAEVRLRPPPPRVHASAPSGGASARAARPPSAGSPRRPP